MSNPENTQPTADASRHTPMPWRIMRNGGLDGAHGASVRITSEPSKWGSVTRICDTTFTTQGISGRVRVEEAEANASLIVEAVNAHARLTRQAEAAKVLRDQLEAVAAELRLRPTDPRSYSLDSYLPEKMYDPILAALAAYEEACK